MRGLMLLETLLGPVGYVNLDTGEIHKFTEEELSKVLSGTKPVIDNDGKIVGVEQDCPFDKENKNV